MECAPKAALSDWVAAARLPFTTVALVPFLVGAFIARSAGVAVNWAAVAAGLGVVLAITVACHLVGEASDVREDSYTLEYGRTKFSGGTLVAVEGRIPPARLRRAAWLVLACGAALGAWIVLQWRSPLIAALGVFGALCAVLYSMPPVRLAARGVGEIFIAVCYGWLTLAAGYACAAGTLDERSFLYSIPLALSIFNVIFINEFPDYLADKAAGKRNLVVRLGRERCAKIYGLTSLLLPLALVALWFRFRADSPLFLLAVLPAALLALKLGRDVALAGKWRDLSTLEPVCGQGILLDHITAVTIGVLLAA